MCLLTVHTNVERKHSEIRYVVAMIAFILSMQTLITIVTSGYSFAIVTYCEYDNTS